MHLLSKQYMVVELFALDLFIFLAGLRFFLGAGNRDLKAQLGTVASYCNSSALP
jgi:hypothetical protein